MTTWTPQTKNPSSFSTQTRSTSSFTIQSKTFEGTIVATAGLVMGLLLSFTYSGGQVLTPGTLPSWTNQNKS